MSDSGHIFISYSRKDGNEQAAKLQSALQDRQFAVWRDVRNLRPDQDFTADIEKGIEAASHVVVCLTQDTKRDNSFVRREIQYALALKRPVIPLRFEDIPPHVSIVNNEWVDFFKGWDTAFRRICAILSGESYQNQPDDAPPDPFKPYLQQLYQRIVHYLKQAIITREIALISEATPGAVPEQRPDMLDLFFQGAGIAEEADGERPFANFAEAFEHYERQVLLLGEPGAGKTITLMALAREAAAARLDNPDKPLPLLATISSWDAYQQPSFTDWLRDAYPTLKTTDAAQVIEQGKALLLLDGLDELGTDRPVHPNNPTGEKFDPRLRFVEHLNNFIADHPMPRNAMLITCRPKDYGDIGVKINLRGAVTLKPLGETQLAAYLEEQPELLTAIGRDAGLREVAQTPLLLSLFAYAYRDLSADERAELANLQQAGDIRDKIFQYYVTRRYQQETARLKRRGAAMPFTLTEIYDGLGRLAWEKAGDWRAQENVLKVEYIQAALPEDRRPAFIELMTRLNLLAPGEGDTYRFLHLLLHDHFAYPYALQHLSHADAIVRHRAVMALNRLRDLRAVEPLIRALGDTDENVRFMTAAALGDFGDARAMEPLIHALVDPSRNVGAIAATSLGSLGEPALQPLMHKLKAGVEDVILNGFVALRLLGERAVKPLLQKLDDTNEKVRCNAARMLGELGDARAIEPLARALSDADETVQFYAALSLQQLGDIRAVEPLIRALTDADWSIHHDVIVALGALGDVRAVEPLIHVLSNSSSYSRQTVVEALGKLGDARAVEPLIHALTDNDKGVRTSAAKALGQLGDARAVEPLKRLLSDKTKGYSWENTRVCDSAAEAIQRIGTPEALEAVARWREEQENDES